jgi:MoaA/NifB/PqqE/SkfB family radical SAM enzyme
MKMNEILSIASLNQLIRGRQVFIWGARHDGFAARRVLERHGIVQTAFIDSSLALQGKTAFGLPIFLPETFFAKFNVEHCFILIASGFYADEITEMCHSNGFSPSVDLQNYADLKHFNYQIDISGSCNLHCISCPRGNFSEHRKPGFMKPEVYEKLISKILRDDPYTGLISLYNWGEPLLNKDLPEIIGLTNQYGLLSAISSNLSLDTDFSEVIKAKPTWFRVSNSGWGKNYEITHTGAKWSVFYDNLFKLRDWCHEFHPDMIIEVFFHIYKHNRDDYVLMKELCEDLGFTIRYRHAALAPLDNIEKIMDGKPVSLEAEQTRSLQVLSVEEVLDLATAPEELNRPCYYEDHLWINWDLQVANCMEWYKPDLNLVDKDFLSATINELIDARNNNLFCKRCKQRGIHRVFCVYGDEKLIYSKKSI